MGSTVNNTGENMNNAMSSIVDPYFIHHSDNPSTSLVTPVLSGDNYGTWIRAITMALRAKNKLGFVDGTLVKPSSDADPKDVASWERSNDLVSSWLLHSFAPDIRNSILYAATAHEIWKDLRHTQQTCYKLHGYPTKTKDGTALASSSTGPNLQVPIPGITKDQYARLLSLLVDPPTDAPSVPEFYRHKSVIIDEKNPPDSSDGQKGDEENPLDSSEGQKGDSENKNDETDKLSVVSSDVSLIVSSRFPVRDEENPLDSSDVQVGDEGNPLDSSTGQKEDEENENGDMDILSVVSSVVASASKTKGMLKMFISGYDLVVSSVVASARKIKGMPKKVISEYIMSTRVPLVKRLRREKLMHEQAVNFVKEMLEQIDGKTNTETEVIDFLKKTCVVNTAIKYGITEFIKECLDTFPFVISHDLGGETMIQIAIAERNEEILNLILDAGEDQKDDLLSKLDENCNSVLHYVAKIAPSYQLNSVFGAALQMQRETQWYKGIENMVHPFLKHMRNVNGDTAHHVFTEEHKKLVATGEKWMKDTSGSCMVVATLIATVAFAAAFTVPGGNTSDPKNGLPVFLDENTFAIFAVADAVALFSSITSVIMFLAIMTSRYTEENFLKSLPQKLIIGLATLFLKLPKRTETILVAFGAAFTLVLRYRYPWAPIPIAIFGLISVLLFAFQEFPLFLEMVSVTYWPHVFTAKNRRPTLSDKERQRIFKQNIKRTTKKENEKEKEVSTKKDKEKEKERE
ncbi:hypothetical protein MKX03_027353 [Papaver bracteatum]|nr:hypothetical protein MKX03_027353 [Papaver bracteatum]